MRMGISMRRSSCRAHMMLPATGGASRGSGGACLCRSYSFCICTKLNDHLMIVPGSSNVMLFAGDRA